MLGAVQARSWTEAFSACGDSRRHEEFDRRQSVPSGPAAWAERASARCSRPRRPGGRCHARFPNPGQLCSWAKFAPGMKPQPGRTGATGPSATATATSPGCSARQPWSRHAPTPCSGNATDGSPDDEARRKPPSPSDGPPSSSASSCSPAPEAEFHDLGADHFTRQINTAAKKHNHIRQLGALGYKVTFEPAPERHSLQRPGSAALRQAAVARPLTISFLG